MPMTMQARVTSFAPQFLVVDLQRSIAYYRTLGFQFGEPWDGFYAIGHVDGFELHLKEAPQNESAPWGTKDFYIEDPDGNVISFGGRPSA